MRLNNQQQCRKCIRTGGKIDETDGNDKKIKDYIPCDPLNTYTALLWMKHTISMLAKLSPI